MTGILLFAAALAAGQATCRVEALEGRFIERYFAQYPARATEAGRSDRDSELEDLSPASVRRWLAFLAEVDHEAAACEKAKLDAADALDLEVLRRAVAQERFRLVVRRAPERDPLFWTAVASDAAIYLLLRDDQPLQERVGALARRAAAVPRLVSQAQRQLGATDARRIAPELVAAAADQAGQLARLYGKGMSAFAASASGESARALVESGRVAAAALDGFERFLRRLAKRARGSALLGDDYREAFRLALGVVDAPQALLPRFESDLAQLRKQTAAYGRTVFGQLVPGRTAPADDRALIRELFSAIEDRHDTEVAMYARYWEDLVPRLEQLVRERAVISLPDPRTLKILPAPPWLLGQASGGVFPAGPFRPEGETLLLLPVPPADASPQARDQFFRAFNRPFSTMIAAHEAMPGHYVQLKIAARQPRRLRALFPDAVYAEGWGTFAERLMLDQGWGGAAERIAHLKKQLENCARAVVDIRVHTAGMSHDEVLRFVRDDALQDAQLADNLWRRTLTSAPQLVTYHLGYRQIDALYSAASRNPSFTLRSFTDALMSLGAIPLRHYTALLKFGDTH